MAEIFRGLKITAVEFRHTLWLKTLIFARICKSRVLDPQQMPRERCAEARRIDRKSLSRYQSTRENEKAHTLAGSSKSWPVGILPGGFEEGLAKAVMSVRSFSWKAHQTTLQRAS